MPESLPHELDRVRRPRVQITYDIETAEGRKKIELPFVVGVLADLSGQPEQALPPLKERHAVSIDRDNFHDVLARAGARLAMRVPNMLTDPNTKLAVELNFKHMDDFDPARVAWQVAPLRELLERRRLLVAQAGQVAPKADDKDPNFPIAQIDKIISAQLNEVLHHPRFQELEGAWRGLYYLVQQSETGENLMIRALNVTKKELIGDAEKAAKFDQSVLFQTIYSEEYGQLGGKPYSMLVGDYQFGRSAEDINLLRIISQVAAAAHAPFVASASPKMFNMDRFDELPRPRDLAKILESVEYAAWKSFRASEDSRYVALTLPRVLSRLPYGKHFVRVSEFDFEETVDGTDHDKYAWMNSAWAYAARITAAFARHGWMERSIGVEGGGKVEGLPVHTFYTDDGGIAMKCPTEIAISDHRALEFANLGFLPLLHNKDTANTAFMDAQSCQKPKPYFDPAANLDAQMGAKLNLLLCASRFVHYLKVLARDISGAFVEAAETQKWLQNWINNYVDPAPTSEEHRAQRPLAEAGLEIRQVKSKPGWHELVIGLSLHTDSGETARFRLHAEIPRRH